MFTDLGKKFMWEKKKLYFKMVPKGNSLEVQWSRLHTFTARPGFNPWSGN